MTDPASDPATDIVGRLTLEEKCRLVAGVTSWRTPAVARCGIGQIKMSDGPNGVRGEHSAGERTPSVVLPVGVAQGATWDPELVGRLGDLLGREARRKSAHVVLAPAVNLHRTPIGGRTFEYFSEDPELTAALAVAVVTSVQAHDVAVTVKHFVANDTEVERFSVDVRVDERVLRELYLRPFEAAVCEGRAWGVMSAYNRLAGEHCAANSWLLQDVLRRDWGFDGFVVSDWFGAHDTVGSASAGLSIEMPGPARIYGEKLQAAVTDGRVDAACVDALVRDVLRLAERVRLHERSADEPERSVDDPADRALCRAAAAAGTVLARNENAALPLSGVGRIAVIGPNAAATRIMGGGSSALRALPYRSILDELRSRLGGVVYEPGCRIDKHTPLLEGEQLRGPDDEPGLEVSFVNGTDESAPVAYRTRFDTSMVRFFGAAPEGVDIGPCTMTIRGTFRADTDGRHQVGIIVTGRARVRVGDIEVLDAETELPRSDNFYGYGCDEQLVEMDLRAGDQVDVEVVMRLNRPFAGVRVGVRAPEDPRLLDRAVEAAEAADAAIVVVGTNDEWETEGADRSDIALPCRQDELVAKVAAANPRTIVVVNAGAPVAMPWVDDVAAVVIPFFGGQEMAPAVADILLGVVDPGGRLPITYPRRLDDVPAMAHYRPVDGVQIYGEGYRIGYRGFDATGVQPLFPFGHGLSYGDASWAEPVTSATVLAADGQLTVTVPVTATGPRDATVVVQGYVAPIDPPVVREPKALRAWVKAVVPAGTTAELALHFTDRAFRRWDVSSGRWTVDPGRYDVLVAASAADVRFVIPVTIQ